MKRWASGQHLGPKVAQAYIAVKECLSAKLERIAAELLDALSEKIATATLKDAAATLGLVIDKMRLLKEEPTVISKVTDRRELIEVVIERRHQNGRWPLNLLHPEHIPLEMETSVGRASRWNTLRALRVLRWYTNSTWQL